MRSARVQKYPGYYEKNLSDVMSLGKHYLFAHALYYTFELWMNYEQEVNLWLKFIKNGNIDKEI
jgi:hypothetical protein